MEYYFRSAYGHQNFIESIFYRLGKSSFYYITSAAYGKYDYSLSDIFTEDLKYNRVKELCKQNKWEF